jgi:very-short-patch-repair endonuclease
MANARARQLRKRQTIAEIRLWKELRKLRHHGYHFRRQAPIENYIVDFACFSQRVVIELDGIQHHEPLARRKDAARDADLTWRGFKVLRFRNGDVSETPEGVMLEILGALGVVERPSDTGERIPRGSPPPLTPPRKGEGDW